MAQPLDSVVYQIAPDTLVTQYIFEDYGKRITYGNNACISFSYESRQNEDAYQFSIAVIWLNGI